MKILISIGGNCSSNIKQKFEYEKVIGVDSGVKHLNKFAITPDLIIGDLDSIDKKLLTESAKKNIEIIKYPKNKDQTDFEIALDYAQKLEFESIDIIGGENGEIDHLLSIFMTISINKCSYKTTWFYGKQKILFNPKSISINLNQIFSLIPLSNIKNLNISGAKWNLQNKNIDFGSTRTLRNESVERLIKISCDEGKYCIIY